MGGRSRGGIGGSQSLKGDEGQTWEGLEKEARCKGERSKKRHKGTPLWCNRLGRKGVGREQHFRQGRLEIDASHRVSAQRNQRLPVVTFMAEQWQWSV